MDTNNYIIKLVFLTPLFLKKRGRGSRLLF